MLPSFWIRPYNTVVVEFDCVHIYLRIRKGRGSIHPAKNKEENIGEGLPTTGRDISHWPESCVGTHHSPQRPLILPFYIDFMAVPWTLQVIFFERPRWLYTCTGKQREFQLSHMFLQSESRMFSSFPSVSAPSQIQNQTARIKGSSLNNSFGKNNILVLILSLLALVSSCSNLCYSCNLSMLLSWK